jgi:Ca2+-binding RTX toxin-like protein
MGTCVSISGGGDAKIHIYGNGTVIAGGGNDSVRIDGNGKITVGAGNDHITLHGSGSILQKGAGGHDTINIGHGHDTVTEAGTATIYGGFGSATVQGGTISFKYHEGKDEAHERGHKWQGDVHSFHQAAALSGNATLLGGTHCTEFVGGTGKVIMQGGTGNDTFIGGSGHTTMTGGSAHNLFEFTKGGKGGADLVNNFVHGHDKLYLEGKSFCWLQSHHDITVSGGNTYISLDGGKTTVELKGFTDLKSSDITSHKG